MASKANHKDLRVRGRLVVEEVLGALLPGTSSLAENRRDQGGGRKALWVKPTVENGKQMHEPGEPLWLQDSTLLVALLKGGELLAFAKGKELVIANTTGSGGDVNPQAFVCHEVQRITCLEWLLFPGHGKGSKDGRLQSKGGFVGLAVGTSEGWLLIYSHSGVMLARQMLHTGPVLRLHARGPAMGLSRTDPSQDLCAVFENAIVRIDALELQSALRRSLVVETNRETNSFGGNKGENSEMGGPASLSFRKWRVQKGFGPCSDGAIGGLFQGPLLDLQDGRPEYCILTVGNDPTIAAFRAPEEMGNLSASLIASRVARNVTSAASTVLTLSKATVAQAPRLGAGLGLPSWSTDAAQVIISNIGLVPGPSAEGNVKGSHVDVHASEKGESAGFRAALKDPLRQALSLTVAGRGPLMAVTDSLGRVLLVDVNSFVVVRQWKGYRDASCAFLEVPASDHVADTHKSQSLNASLSSQLCLAVFAPRKGSLEVWQLRNGPRLMWLRCGSNCRLLQPSSSFGSLQLHTNSGTDERQRAYLFHGDGGQLFEISPSMNASRVSLAGSTSEKGVITEWDIYHRLSDLLHYQSGATEAARQILLQLSVQPLIEKPDVTLEPIERQQNEHRFSKQVSLTDEEPIILNLLEALDVPTRKLKALDMIFAFRPSLSPSCQLEAVRNVLAKLDATFQLPQRIDESGQTIRPGLEPVVRPAPLASPTLAQQSAGSDQMDKNIISTTTLRRRVTSSGNQEEILGEGTNSRGMDVKIDGEGPKLKDQAEGASSEVNTGHLFVQNSKEFQQRMLKQLKERQGRLKWHERLLEVFILLRENYVRTIHVPRAPKPIKLLPKLKVRGPVGGVKTKDETWERYKWKPGSDLQVWLEIGGPKVVGEHAENQNLNQNQTATATTTTMATNNVEGIEQLPSTCGDFVRAFVTDPNTEPPHVNRLSLRSSQEQKGLSLVSVGDSGIASRSIGDVDRGVEDDITRLVSAVGKMTFSGLSRGEEASRRVFQAMDLLPLSGHEWQQLFLGWLSDVSLDELYKVESSLWLDLIERMGCVFQSPRVNHSQHPRDRSFEGTGSARTAGTVAGGRYPLFFHRCQLHSATSGMVILARACSMLADKEQETIGMRDSEETDEKSALKMAESTLTEDEASWLEYGADQWRRLTKQVEDAYWLGSIVNYVIRESESRGLVSPTRRSASAAEVSSFPIAAWVARLELLISPSARTLSALHSKFISSFKAHAGLTSIQSARLLHLSAKASSSETLTEAVRGDKDFMARNRSGQGKERIGGSNPSVDVEQHNGTAEAGELIERVETTSKYDTEEVAKYLLCQAVQRFPQTCHLDILAAHRALELCRQWANLSQSSRIEVSPSGTELLLVAQEHMAHISTLGLKGGIVALLWASLIGPRAASVVGLVERLARAPTDEECSETLGMAGLTVQETSDSVAAYEQLLALLFDCATLAEAGLTRDPDNVREEDKLGLHDATCRDAVADFRLRAPNSESVHAYMLLLRTVGSTLALGVSSVQLSTMFSLRLLATFPALFQDVLLGHDQVVGERTAQVSLEAKLQFLQAALLRQRVMMEEGGKGGTGSHGAGAMYARRSISSLAADLDVPHKMLRQREGVVRWLMTGVADESAGVMM